MRKSILRFRKANGLFTGLIENIGVITSSRAIAGGMSLEVNADFEEPLEPGESIAVDGVCLTVAEVCRNGFRTDVSRETLDRTTLGNTRVGEKANIERALKAGSRLGGHLVQGHVDCVGRVVRLIRRDDFASLEINFRREYISLAVEKGSIVVSGVSLTIAKIKSNVIEIAVIPETLKRTTIGDLKPGKEVNLEFDIIAKYVQKQIG